MKNIYLFLLLTNILFACTDIKKDNKTYEKYAIIAYYHARDTILDEKNILVKKLTHINYSFANIVNGKIAEGSQYDSINFVKLNMLKKKNPNLKVLISVGGWSGSGNFSDMTLTKESRKLFIISCIDFINKYQLDGIDLDWEYPGLPGIGNTHRPEDKANFTYLLKELRQALNKNNNQTGKAYTLTIAAAAFPEYIKNIELSKIVQYLDFINLMTYDFVGGWQDSTGYHTNLYTPPDYPQANSCDKAIRYYIKNGAPPKKLVIGLAFYARGWTKVYPVNNGRFQKAYGKGLEASYKNIVENYIGKNGYKAYYDSIAQSPYLWNDNLKTFITYENTLSITAKCNYAVKHKLCGVMFWQYTSDYKHELLNSISFNKN